MKIIIHNLLNGSNKTYEGDATTLERQLEIDFPWAVEGNEFDLNHILWIIDHQQFHAVEVVDKSPHPFLKEDLNKAIEDLPPGQAREPDWKGQPQGGTSYTHLLPDNLRKEGYQIIVDDGVSEDEGPEIVARVLDPQGFNVGRVEATRMFMGTPQLRIRAGAMQRHVRSKGLGLSAYEAVLKHAKDKHGVTHVRGGSHSTMAHGLHTKLAEKHGLKYHADKNISGYGTPYEWRNAPTGSFDGKYGPYKYTIKDELDVEDFMDAEPLAKAQKVVIPPRYLIKYERNLDGWMELEGYNNVAMEQAGAIYNIQRHLEGARVLLGLKKDEGMFFNDAYRLLTEETTDIPGAALKAYGIRDNEQNRTALSLVLNDDLAKEELPGIDVQSYKIVPIRPEAEETANAVQRGIDSGYLNPVKLSGKHSKGTMLVKDPQTKIIYLLKPGSGKNSPAMGVNEVRASQSEREAAFFHVAEYIGIGDAFPRADLIAINGHQTAAMELLPTSYHNLGTKKREDNTLPARILDPYRQNGTLFKWSFIDYILGNPDRHSQNMMVDPDNRRVRLIDHGSAMAGQSFSPATDKNSFIPYYLRAWTGRKFTEMTPQERIHMMPGLSDRQSAIFDEWVDGIDENHIVEILRDYNIDPSATLERIAQIRAMPGPKWLVLNKLWAGGI